MVPGRLPHTLLYPVRSEPWDATDQIIDSSALTFARTTDNIRCRHIDIISRSPGQGRKGQEKCHREARYGVIPSRNDSAWHNSLHIRNWMVQTGNHKKIKKSGSPISIACKSLVSVFEAWMINLSPCSREWIGCFIHHAKRLPIVSIPALA